MEPDYDAQMREWAERKGVKPLWVGFDPGVPYRITDAWISISGRDAHRLRKGLRWRDEAQREFYAGWDAYEASKVKMSHEARDVQSRAEVYELERWLRL